MHENKYNYEKDNSTQINVYLLYLHAHFQCITIIIEKLVILFK